MNLGLDEQGIPVCEPFLSIEDVLSWTPPEFCCNGVKFDAKWKKPRLGNCLMGEVNRPKFLICHDMCGGYLDDRLTQGSDNPDAYRFYNWSVIDTFIYFSHRFVTVPPFGWVCAAHQNGVHVLGLIITEWAEGASICKQLLQSKEYIDVFISKLVEIMLFHGFEGWLINIENEIQSESIPLLQYFVQQLKLECHSHLSHAQVLWYDSVTREGKLQWQNELNDENEMFFETSDGIFLNYALTDNGLKRSMKKARLFNRQFDVYAGVDVFGRSTPGGGGFNCKQIVKSILKHDLSCALFAQGWVYEHHGMKDFDENEKKFWHLLSDELVVKSVSLPISTSFCHGYGKKYFLEGKIISENGWHNLSLQQQQPSYPCDIHHDEAYIGGGCLKLSLNEGNTVPVTWKLFRLNLQDKEPLSLSAIWNAHGLQDSYTLGFVLSHDFNNCPKAFVLMEDCSVDINSVKNSLNSSIFVGKPIQHENVMFLLSNEKPTYKNLDWIESSFTFETSVLLNNAEASMDVNLSLILVPRQTRLVSESEQTHRSMPISVGHLKVFYKQKKDCNLVPTDLVKGSCLLVETPCPLSRTDKEFIISHQCFYTHCEALCPGQLGMGTQTLQKSSFGPKSDDHLKVLDAETVMDTVTAHPLMYFLHWKVSHCHSINFYLIFFQDNTGVEHYVGSCVSNHYIFIQKQTAIHPINFVIQPVLKGAYLFGQKFVIGL